MKDAVQIPVPSKDPEEKKDERPDRLDAPPKDDSKAPDNELSEEDRKLKDDLEVAVQRLCSAEETDGVKHLALEYLRNEIRTATSSMTSVPKPLKFLRPSYEPLKVAFETFKAGETKIDLADILAVLAMTMAKEGSRESLKYKLQGRSTELGSWGHEFVRSLAGEVGEEYNARLTTEVETEPNMKDLQALVDAIVPFHMNHNAEPEAIDILIEVQQLSSLAESKAIDEKNYQRVCLYLLACADFMSDPDDLLNLLNTAYSIFLRLEQYPDALRVALRLGDENFVAEVFAKTKDEVVRKQLGYILGRQRFFYEDENDTSVNDIIGNTDLSDKFLSLARDLDVLEAKTPEDIYKSHLSETGSVARSRDSGSQPADSARHNLASTFVNAFVNAGYGTDKLMTPEGNTWLYKNKKHGMMSAAASLGMIMLWNVEEGITQIDKFLYSGDEFVKAGAILGVGIVSAGIRNEVDPPLALLSEHIDSGNCSIRCASCLGLGIAYAGSGREDVSELLIPVVSHADENADIQEVSYAALALGMVEVGTCDEEAGSVLMQRLMESSDTELDASCSRFLALGLGLLYLGRQERVEAMLEAAKTIEHKISKYLAITLETCAYAGSGNVLKIQQLLRSCAEHIEDPEAAQHQSVAVIGIALIAMGENVGSEMAMRSFDHLLQYGEVAVRRAVPLAFALLSISNPEYTLIDTLSRLTHDADGGVAQNAILALGLVSAGTNNSRVAGLLRQLSEFYSREANHLFVVRIAQGLLHMGKGLITLHPYHSDRLVMSRVAVSGLLAVLHASLDMEHTILDTSHYILYCIATAMQPRMLVTLDEELNPLPVSVRVGQAVEIVGQAGRPKSITGFQTHTTPVLLNVKDRAELASDEYIPLTNVLEGVVILRKNPDFQPET
ncbi:26S proteasome non-atpase regulatory subunit 2 [Globisporangium polare]